ncbi:hypothetical protein Mapa_008948 [Marchantia paleacea]|nr:hypothetical protein Mapa_008948 [Marchantia paleacea]
MSSGRISSKGGSVRVHVLVMGLCMFTCVTPVAAVTISGYRASTFCTDLWSLRCVGIPAGDCCTVKDASMTSARSVGFEDLPPHAGAYSWSPAAHDVVCGTIATSGGGLPGFACLPQSPGTTVTGGSWSAPPALAQPSLVGDTPQPSKCRNVHTAIPMRFNVTSGLWYQVDAIPEPH